MAAQDVRKLAAPKSLYIDVICFAVPLWKVRSLCIAAALDDANANTKQSHSSSYQAGYHANKRAMFHNARKETEDSRILNGKPLDVLTAEQLAKRCCQHHTACKQGTSHPIRPLPTRQQQQDAQACNTHNGCANGSING